MHGGLRLLLAAALFTPFCAGIGLVACSSDNPAAFPGDDGGDASPRDADADADTDTDTGATVDAAKDAGARAADATGLGSACVTDFTCADGLSCWTYLAELDFIPPHFPSGGMCTALCKDDKACEALGAGAQCDPTLHVCTETCSFGGGDGGFDPARCRGRPNLACNFAVPPICAPMCNSNADCPKTSPCEAATGMCSVGGVSTDLGAVIGKAVDAGGCGSAIQMKVIRPDTNHFVFYCSALCTFGAPYGCGWDGSAPVHTYCLPVPAHPETTTGDLGECAQTCDCDSDCTYPLSCVAVLPELAQKTGHRGACIDKHRDPDAAVFSCEIDGGLDASDDGG